MIKIGGRFSVKSGWRGMTVMGAKRTYLPMSAVGRKEPVRFQAHG